MRETGSSGVAKKVIVELQKHGGWWTKIHGSRYQTKGIPDIIGSLGSTFFGFEVKAPGKEDELKDYQKYNIECILLNGEGIACMVVDPYQARVISKRTAGRVHCVTEDHDSCEVCGAVTRQAAIVLETEDIWLYDSVCLECGHYLAEGKVIKDEKNKKPLVKTVKKPR